VPGGGGKPAKEITSLVQSVYSLIEYGDFKKSLLVLDEILQIAPNDERALLLKVQILLFFRKLRDADKTASMVIGLYPKDHHVYLAKAISTFLYTNNIREAISYLDKGLELKSDCFELIITKAQMLYWLNDASYNAWIQQASQIDSSRTAMFLKKYWIDELMVPPSHIGAQFHGLVQSLMFLASQQSFGGWK